MEYTFSAGALFIGLAILIASGCVVIFYRQIADNLASGVSSYDRVKLFGIIGCILGLVVMTSLHTLILSLLISIVFPH